MSRVYNRRTWLSSGFHSHSYVACYYDVNCPNNYTRNLLKIADCENVCTIYKASVQIKEMLETISAILSVVRGEVKEVEIQTESNLVRLKVTLSEEDRTKGFEQELKIQRSKLISVRNKQITFGEYRDYVTLHADSQTCPEEEWRSKLKILETELVAFHEFLSSLE